MYFQGGIGGGSDFDRGGLRVGEGLKEGKVLKYAICRKAAEHVAQGTVS